MSDERERDETDEERGLSEGQLAFDSAALESALPEVMGFDEMRHRNRLLWRQQGGADTER